ncbi:MAG: MATE family efflux transporter, partial [Turicibacter sp.]
TLILATGCLLIKVFPGFFVGIFTNDKHLIDLAIGGLNIQVTTLSTIGITILGAVYFQTIGVSKVAMFLSLLRQVIILIPLIIVLPRFYGLNGIWIAQPMADLLAMMIVVVFLILNFKPSKAVFISE